MNINSYRNCEIFAWCAKATCISTQQTNNGYGFMVFGPQGPLDSHIMCNVKYAEHQHSLYVILPTTQIQSYYSKQNHILWYCVGLNTLVERKS